MNTTLTLTRAAKDEKPRQQPKPGLPPEQEKKLHQDLAARNHASQTRPKTGYPN